MITERDIKSFAQQLAKLITTNRTLTKIYVVETLVGKWIYFQQRSVKTRRISESKSSKCSVVRETMAGPFGNSTSMSVVKNLDEIPDALSP